VGSVDSHDWPWDKYSSSSFHCTGEELKGPGPFEAASLAFDIWLFCFETKPRAKYIFFLSAKMKLKTGKREKSTRKLCTDCLFE